MHRRLTLCVLLAAFLLPAHAEPGPPPSGLLRAVGPGTVDWGRRLLTVTGEGQAADGPADAQRRLLGKRAAVADGYRRLAEAINGVQVTTHHTVDGIAARQALTRLRVQALIQGAAIGEAIVAADGRVRVPVSLPLFGADRSLAWGVDLGRWVATMSPSAPLQDGRRSSWQLASLTPFSLAGTGAVTGLVVDAGGLGAEPAMAPFLLGAGRRVYLGGQVVVDPDRIVSEGLSHYVDDLQAALADRARVGENPLIVVAKAAIGRPSTDILLASEDVARLERLNQLWHFLDELRVTIVI